ncbi:MAG: antitoxin [Trebonia sp.]
MPDFKALINKAKGLAGKHPDQVSKGVDKAEEFAEGKLGHKYDDQIKKGGDMVEGQLGVHDTEPNPE